MSKRRRRVGTREAAREHGLEHLAGVDLLDQLGHAGLVPCPRRRVIVVRGPLAALAIAARRLVRGTGVASRSASSSQALRCARPVQRGQRGGLRQVVERR